MLWMGGKPVGDLTENFSRSEFACKCGCGFNDIDRDLVNILQGLRNWFNSPVRINSACRCATHNKSVGGATGSKHLEGIAADITVDGLAPSDIHIWLSRFMGESGGLGLYSNFVHADVRKTKARWKG